jgi:Leucine-rich repeat (LRR) protein
LPCRAYPLQAVARLFTLLLLGLLPGSVWAITILDPRLEAAIRSTLGKPTGVLSSTDMLALTGLSAENDGITNLTGLEWAGNLKYLDLEFNQVSDLSPLAGLRALQALFLANNRLSSAGALAGLTNLTALAADNNSLHDVSWLAGLSRLTSLGLMFNPVGNSTAYAGLTNLTDLHLNGTGLSDVSWLRNMPKLLSLGVGDNSLTNASPVAGLTRLQFLGLGGMHLGSCAVVAGLTNLQTLYLFSEALTDVSCLAGLKKLSWLRVSDNNLKNAAPLGGLTQLGYLDLSYNLLSNLNFATTLTGLTNLDVSYNQLTDISGLLGLANLGLVNLLSEPPLNLAVGSPAYNVIQTLLSRGVLVQWAGSGTSGAPSVSAVTNYLSSTNALTAARTMTLKATANPNNLATLAYFQFGPNPTYAGSTPATSLPAGGAGVDFSASIDAIVPGVLYHYRAVATNSLGVATSADQSFQLPPLYVPGDSNGDGMISQNELNIVLANYWPNSPWLAMTNTTGLGSTTVQFALTNANNWDFSVLVSTNLKDWRLIGSALPVYQFSDPAATNAPKRFYRLRWP